MSKIIEQSALAQLRKDNAEKKIIFTCGCFDLLHVGHLRYLQEAAKLGDMLVIGLNTDNSVKRLKGEQRPIVCEKERAEMLAAYDFIDYICFFDEDTPRVLLENLKPNVFAKGGDWIPENLPCYDICKQWNIEVRFLQIVDDRSTTLMLRKMNTVEKKYRIAVIGDAALDLTYVSHRSEEYLDEPDFYAQYVDRMSYDAGGAGNLASDIAVNEDTDVDLYSYCGNDVFGIALKEALNKNKVNTNTMVTCNEMNTYVYHYFFDGDGKEYPRHDIGRGNVHSHLSADMLLKKIEERLERYDAIVLNEQHVSSIHDAYFKEKLAVLLDKVKAPIFLDCQHQVPYQNCTMKINIKEARRYTGETEPEACCKKLYETYIQPYAQKNAEAGKSRRYIIVSLGAKGAMAYDGERFTFSKGVLSEGQIFAVGAGDAFLAGLSYQAVKDSDIAYALKYANASGAACTKFLFECGHPNPAQIEEMMSQK